MIAWIDIETTALEVDAGDPLEIACILTDDALRTHGKCNFVIHFQSEWEGIGPRSEYLKNYRRVSDHVIDMHTKNGLWDEAQTSQHELHEVDSWVAEFIGSEKPVLAGSTISFDRKWIEAYFPRLNEKLHYRNIDVSGFKETARRFAPHLYEQFEAARQGDKPHRAMDDIRESMREYRWYLDHFIPGWRGDAG